MNQEDLNRLQRLPRRPHSTWCGGWLYFPMWVDEGNQPPFRPRAPIWLNTREGGAHVGRSKSPSESSSQNEALAALLEFACDRHRAGYLPGSIEVNDAELVDVLARDLSELGVSVRLRENHPAVAEAEQHFAESLGRPKMHSLLTAPGIDDALLGRFASAAAALYSVAPWRYLVDQDYLVAEGTSHPPAMGCVSVLGAGKQTEGLSFFASPNDLFALVERAPGKPKALTAGSVTFDPLASLPLDDAARWVDRGWPVSPGRLYPLFFFLERGKVRGPTMEELLHAIDWMEALGATQEAEIDTGRWEKVLGDSGRRFVITLPNLLKPSSDRELRPRGGMFDRRSMESLHAKIARYFEDHPAGSIDEMNRILQEKFVGSLDDLTEDEPRTPAERAQQLCYQAFDAFGRRRILLARQAIATDPNCADAYNLLAEAAYEPADALRYYEQALAAAERTLGPQFDESVGHFWGLQATRPYMRARQGCGHLLDQLGRTAESIAHGWEMLRLNPNDNQGIRYELLAWLLKTHADQDAGKLLKQFDESTAHWSYARVLLAYRLSGSSAAVERELAAAMKSNCHVPARLLSDEEFQAIERYSLGSPEEAEYAASELYPAYESTPGALEWLAANQQRVVYKDLARERASRHKDLDRKKNENKKQGKRKRR